MLPLRVRLAEISDAARVAEIFTPYVSDTVISFAEVPPTMSEWEARIEKTLAQFPFLVLEGGDGVVGYAYASPHRALSAYRWACEVSVYIDKSCHGLGGASILYGALFALLRVQGLHVAYAGITLPNPPSSALHEKFGFQFFARYEAVGFKRGTWLNVGWWSLRLLPRSPAAPVEPVHFAALREKQSVTVSRILAG